MYQKLFVLLTQPLLDKVQGVGQEMTQVQSLNKAISVFHTYNTAIPQCNIWNIVVNSDSKIPDWPFHN
jgi:hypothetical protein